VKNANELRPGLPPLPGRIKSLPVNDKGYPVPWFVSWLNGEPEFRAADVNKLHAAVRMGRCWICGGVLGKFRVFVIGPMGAINRMHSEPPSHYDCADFAAKACPFLVFPNAKRREANMPEHADPIGLDPSNPGVYVLWVTQQARVFDAGGSLMFNLGDPEYVQFRSAGRSATRAEVVEAIAHAERKLVGIAGSDDTLQTAVRLGVAKLMTYAPDEALFQGENL
jgi:hypothetical protein